MPLDLLRSAVRTQDRLAIHWVNGDDRAGERLVWPIERAFTDSVRVLISWSELRDALHFFRTDRKTLPLRGPGRR